MIERYPTAILIGEAPGLDFLNSVARPTDTVIDWIDGGEGFLNWLGEVRLIPAATLDALRQQALPWELDKVADEARQLREWFRSIVIRHKGRPLGLEILQELTALNRLLERDESFTRIVMQNDEGRAQLRVERTRRWRSPESLLLPIAEAFASLVCDEDFTDIKACEGPACTMVFVDRTRGRARRWCSMATCGNRAKQATHRSRVRSQHDQQG